MIKELHVFVLVRVSALTTAELSDWPVPALLVPVDRWILSAAEDTHWANRGLPYSSLIVQTFHFLVVCSGLVERRAGASPSCWSFPSVWLLLGQVSVLLRWFLSRTEPQYSWTNSLQFLRFFSGSQVLLSWPKPSHVTRYFFLRPSKERTCSTSCSNSPAISSGIGGGILLLSLLYCFSKLTWNTLCIFISSLRFSL